MKKASKYLKRQETFHFWKSYWLYVGYVVSMSIIFLLVIIIPVFNHARIIQFFIGLFAFGLLILFNEKIYIPFRYHDKRADNYQDGIIGERKIQRELKKLPKNLYSVFFDVPLEYGNIDFVVVGPNNVFTIEVKNYEGVIENSSGKLKKNGFSLGRDILSWAKYQAASLYEILNSAMGSKLFIKPVVVFVGDEKKLAFDPAEISGVLVTHHKALIDDLQRCCQNSNAASVDMEELKKNLSLYALIKPEK